MRAGDQAPSGRLPASWPRDEADLPPFDNTALVVEYGYFHGYRHLDQQGVEPRFPFGFGLTYTTFSYDNLRLAATGTDLSGVVEVEVDVTNDGCVAAIETVRLCVAYQESSVERAARDLRGFARVAREPVETRTVNLSLRVVDMAYWDTASAGFFFLLIETLSRDHMGPCKCLFA